MIITGSDMLQGSRVQDEAALWQPTRARVQSLQANMPLGVRLQERAPAIIAPVAPVVSSAQKARANRVWLRQQQRAPAPAEQAADQARLSHQGSGQTAAQPQVGFHRDTAARLQTQPGPADMRATAVGAASDACLLADGLPVGFELPSFPGLHQLHELNANLQPEQDVDVLPSYVPDLDTELFALPGNVDLAVPAACQNDSIPGIMPASAQQHEASAVNSPAVSMNDKSAHQLSSLLANLSTNEMQSAIPNTMSLPHALTSPTAGRGQTDQEIAQPANSFSTDFLDFLPDSFSHGAFDQELQPSWSGELDAQWQQLSSASAAAAAFGSEPSPGNIMKP